MFSAELVGFLQTAIGPVILISGVGLLLLSMTNRLGRVIDRTRAIVAGKDFNDEPVEAQLIILWRRAHLLRTAILLTGASAFFSGILIMVIFTAALFGFQIYWLIAALFVLALLAMISGLVHFLRDVNLSLDALRLELRDHKHTHV